MHTLCTIALIPAIRCLERLMDLQAAQRNQLLLTASQEKLSGLPPAGCKHTLDCKKTQVCQPDAKPKASKSTQIISNHIKSFGEKLTLLPKLLLGRPLVGKSWLGSYPTSDLQTQLGDSRAVFQAQILPAGLAGLLEVSNQSWGIKSKAIYDFMKFHRLLKIKGWRLGELLTRQSACCFHQDDFGNPPEMGQENDWH